MYRQLKFASVLFIVTLAATSHVAAVAAQEELAPTREQVLEMLPPGFEDFAPERQAEAAAGLVPKEVYTHFNGTFIVDPNGFLTPSHTILLTRGINASGHYTTPLYGYDRKIYYVGSGTIPALGCFGRLCIVPWSGPHANEMPWFLFFCVDAGHCRHCPHCHKYGHNVYSWRPSTGKWRYVGCFKKTPHAP